MPGFARSPMRDAVLRDVDFARIAELVHGIAGIVLPENKRPLVQSRLTRRLQALGLESFSDYADFAMQKGNDEERSQLVTAVTTNVTAFFREHHHFDTLSSAVLPALADRARSGGRVRIWSAGCSSGEEPYSIAACLLAVLPDAARFDVKILATDIDEAMIARVREARYAPEALATVPPALLRRLVRPSKDAPTVRMSDAARRLVTVKGLNLQGNWPMSGPFDVIFCRNVVIYFDRATQERLWSRFADLLTPGGYLMIGHSERITGEASSRFSVDAITTYKRRN